jgi:hypothetical protein
VKKKAKTALELMQEVRNTWNINPITRVHDNDARKDRRKRREEGRKTVRDAAKEYGTNKKSDCRDNGFFCLRQSCRSALVSQPSA